jgi:hypothetical protein
MPDVKGTKTSMLMHNILKASAAFIRGSEGTPQQGITRDIGLGVV